MFKAKENEGVGIGAGDIGMLTDDDLKNLWKPIDSL